jgi:hypothetical protein
LSSPFRINTFSSVSTPSNTLCFTWGFSLDDLSKARGINGLLANMQIPRIEISKLTAIETLAVQEGIAPGTTAGPLLAHGRADFEQIR